MKVVCDSSSLINLASANQLPLLQRLFGAVLVPRGVYEEVVLRGQGKIGSAEVKAADYIKVKPVNQARRLSQDKALSQIDLEVAALAMQEEADLVVTRDSRLRRSLRQQGVAAITTSALLIEAKHRGHLAAVKPVLDQMRANGTLIREPAYKAVLEEAGEK